MSVKASFENGENECSVSLGGSATLSAEKAGESELVWRENFSNPQFGLIEDDSAASFTVTPEKPGTYCFLCYAQNDKTISAPSVLTLYVTKEAEQIDLCGSLAGVVITNTVYGCDITGECILRAVGKNYALAVSNEVDGTFILEGLPYGEVKLCLSSDRYAGVVYETVISNEAQVVTLEAEDLVGSGIVYAQLDDNRSKLPIKGAFVVAGSKTGTTTDKGRSTALTLPYGQYVMTVEIPGRELVVTNISPDVRAKTFDVVSEGYSPFVHGFLYGTGGETVKSGTIQVLSDLTKNIVDRHNMNGVPFYFIGLTPGHPVTLRYRLDGYDNENYSINSDSIVEHDVVLTPEPALIALIALLFALKWRR